MTDEIARDKAMSEMTPEDWANFQRTRQRPESDEHREAKTKALKDAGLEPDGEQLPDDPSEWSAEQHYSRMRSDR
jgi:hypothetical protein